MKAFFKSFASAGLAVLFGVGTLGGTAALAEMSEHRGENVPEEIKTENVALGKEVTFRSLMDMNETLTMYSYFPNNGGIDGTGCYDISAGGNVMTDGVNSEWGGYTVNSTWAGVRGWAYLDLGKSYDISAVKIHMLAAWCFMDVVVQVSDDALFQKDVATIFSVCDTLSSEGTTVYDGGKVGCTEETKGETGWNGREGVDSKQAEGNIFSCNVSARYVRFTNNCGTPEQNGGADENTAISEIEVYARTSGLAAPKASVESGTYESLETVELTSSYADAKIYYTLDGSYPTEESALYEGPVDLSGKTGAVALRAIAVVDGKQSYPADYQYKVVEGAYGNQALGKEITFRSLTDMNEVLTMYNYFPDGQGIDGTGCYDISTKGNVMTDGQNTDWMGFNVNSTAANVQGWAFLDLGKSCDISEVKVYFLAKWCFQNVIIQASDDPEFKTGVTTIFSCCDSLEADGIKVYDGGKVGCTEETRDDTGWNGQIGVDSKMDMPTPEEMGNVFTCNVSARYIRLTNTNLGNGGADSNTNFTEIEVYGGESVPDDVVLEKAIKSVKADLDAIEVANGTTKEEVISSLHESVTIEMTDGKETEVAAIWNSENYNGNTAGEYIFTLETELPEHVSDIFGTLDGLSITVTVLPAADKTALETAIESANALKEEDYTSDSWTMLKNALNAAERIAVEGKASQQQVDECTAALEKAVSDLILRAKDKTALKAAIDEAKAIDVDKYLSDGVAGLTEALADAEAVYTDADASVKEAEDALKILAEAIDALQEKADLSALSALIKTVKEAGYKADEYTQATYAALEDALEEAEAMLTQSEVSAEEAKQAYAALDAAVKGLVKYGDSSALKALMETAKSLNEEDYTKNSFDALKEQLLKAEETAARKEIQSVYDEAETALREKINALVSLVGLKEKLSSAREYSAEDYTQLSFEGLKTAIAEAELLLDQAGATAEEVAEAEAAIEDAVAALEHIETDSSGSSSSFSSESSSSSEGKGCGSVAGISAGSCLLFAGAALVLKKRR